jgi:hypothetical protein
MKTIINKNCILILSFAFLFFSCTEEDRDEVLFDGSQFPAAYSFVNINTTETVLGDQTIQYKAVTTTKLSDEEQTFEIVLDEEETTAEPESFNLPNSVTIPANSYEGFVDIEYTINGLPSVPRTIVFNYVVPEGTVLLNSNELKATIDFEAVTLCDNGDLNLDITTDDWPGETTWSIVDEDDNEVAAGGPYDTANADFAETVSGLDSGCYTFTIFDAFGDGICCEFGNGSYTLSCASSGTVIKSGGQFESEESVFFCIN